MTTNTSNNTKSSSTFVDDEDDELDIIKLVSTNANDSNQYLIFVGSNDELYAKNVSKIEELLVYKDLEIAKSTDKEFILGTADIRGKMTSIVNFDQWMGNEILPEEDYELVILAAYGGHRFGIIVQKVEFITTIEPNKMSDNSDDNSKSTFITKIPINGEDKLCTIFDSDKMLLDIYENVDEHNKELTDTLEVKVDTDKYVLFADDSKFIRKMVEKLFIKLDLKYKIFDHGRALVDCINSMEVENIALIITDIEMPIMGGREVLDAVRKNSQYDDINIIVHTNMSNQVMEDELLSAGAAEIIGKVNMLALGEAIGKFIK